MKGLNSPLIAEDEGAGVKELKLRFDVSQYTPEEIMVKTVDNKLLVMMKAMMMVMLMMMCVVRYMPSMRRVLGESQCTENITESSFFHKEQTLS